MPNYRSPFPALSDSDEHMRLVGIISAHWEFLDVTIQRALAEVMMHDYGRIAQLTENIPSGKDGPVDGLRSSPPRRTA